MKHPYSVAAIGGLALAAGVSALAEYHWLFDSLANFSMQFFIIAIALFILFIVRRLFAHALIVLLIAFQFGQTLGMYFTPAYAHNVRTTHAFRILHANVNHMNVEHQKLTEIIKQESPSIVVLNEVDEVWVERVFEASEGRLSYRADYPSDDYRGMALLADRPFEERLPVTLSSEDSPVIEVYFPDVGLTVFALHTLAPKSRSWADGRAALMRHLGERVKEAEGLVIVAGDLNSTEYSPIFQELLASGGLSDARQGFGWKPSWLSGTPFALALDHILYKGSAIEPTAFRVLPSVGSDHRPLIADFVLNALRRE